MRLWCRLLSCSSIASHRVCIITISHSVRKYSTLVNLNHAPRLKLGRSIVAALARYGGGINNYLGFFSHFLFTTTSSPSPSETLSCSQSLNNTSITSKTKDHIAFRTQQDAAFKPKPQVQYSTITHYITGCGVLSLGKRTNKSRQRTLPILGKSPWKR